jgi:hypothetical protein
MSDLRDDIKYIGYPIRLHGLYAESNHSSIPDLVENKEYFGYSLYKPSSPLYFSINNTYINIDGQLFCLGTIWEVDSREIYTNLNKYIEVVFREFSAQDFMDIISFLYKKIQEINERLDNCSVSI